MKKISGSRSMSNQTSPHMADASVRYLQASVQIILGNLDSVRFVCLHVNLKDRRP
jgi:hypothetical protein